MLLDQIAERDGQISRLLEERDRSSATFARPHDRVSAVLASPPRRRKTPPRPPAAEPAPTSIEIREEPVAESPESPESLASPESPESLASPESPESPERSESDEEDVTRELFPADDATPPPPRPSQTPPPPSPPRASERTSKRTARTSHPSHDPGYYASHAADWASGRRSTRDDLSVRLFARVRPFVDCDVDATPSLRPSRPGANDLDVVTRRGEVPFRDTFDFDGGVFWEEDDDVLPATTAATWLADATRRGRDATMLVVGSDKGGKTHVADAVVAACAAFLETALGMRASAPLDQNGYAPRSPPGSKLMTFGEVKETLGILLQPAQAVEDPQAARKMGEAFAGVRFVVGGGGDAELHDAERRVGDGVKFFGASRTARGSGSGSGAAADAFARLVAVEGYEAWEAEVAEGARALPFKYNEPPPA